MVLTQVPGGCVVGKPDGKRDCWLRDLSQQVGLDDSSFRRRVVLCHTTGTEQAQVTSVVRRVFSTDIMAGLYTRIRFYFAQHEF